MQAIPGVEGAEGSYVTVQGVLEVGEYLGILEVEIYVEVDEVEVAGVSASSRINISSTATTDEASAMHTLDGDAFDQSAWTCVSGEVCEITYDFGAVESLEQVRIAFSDDSDTGGAFTVYAGGEAGLFDSVRANIGAGGRPVGSDGLQTFGGVRALARYVKIEVTSSIGGTIGITEASFSIHLLCFGQVELQIGEDAPQRAVAEKPWLKETGPLPAGRTNFNYDYPVYDVRVSNEGGCDPPGVFRGCHIFYIKDGDMPSDSRWSCGPTAAGDDFTSRSQYDDGTVCAVAFELNIFRYVRQVQLAFHLGDEQHFEFAIQAYTKNYEWVTVVPSAISSGNTVDLETFDVSVHTDTLRIDRSNVQHQRGEVEIFILERRKNSFVEGTVPVFNTGLKIDGITEEATTHFKFDIPDVGDFYTMYFAKAIVSGLRMKFPKDRAFTFDITYRNSSFDDVSQRFTSARNDRTFETFSMSTPSINEIEIVAVEGPTFGNRPSYPTLRVVDFQIIGEISKSSGTFDMASTAVTTWGYYNGGLGWGRIPDLIAEASADQEVVMTAICETKGAAFDGTDCVGELDETAVTVMPTGGFFVNGPIFLKSNVTLVGVRNPEFGTWSRFYVYDGPNIRSTGEDAVIVIDGATSAQLRYIYFGGWWEEVTGSIVPGTVGNVCLEVRNSQDLRLGGELNF
ncbi:unnamed protein product [Ascophyllum nodosum]